MGNAVSLEISDSPRLSPSNIDSKYESSFMFSACDLLDERFEDIKFNNDVLPQDLTVAAPESVAFILETFPQSEPQSSPPVKSAVDSDADSIPPIINSSGDVPTVTSPKVFDTALSSLIVSSVGGLAHDPQIGGCSTVSIHKLLSAHLTRLNRLHESIQRETEAERKRDGELVQHIQATPSSFVLDDGDDPHLTLFALKSVVDMIAELLSKTTDPVKEEKCWKLLQETISSESVLSLANQLRPLDPQLESAIQPIFQLIKQKSLSSLHQECTTDSLLVWPADCFLLLALARGSLSSMLDVVEFAFDNPSVSFSAHHITSLCEYFHLDVRIPNPERLSAKVAACTLLSAMSAIASRVRPLSAGMLPLSSSSPSSHNPNAQSVRYHPFAIQTEPAVVTRLAILMSTFIALQPSSSLSVELYSQSLLSLIKLMTASMYDLLLLPDMICFAACHRIHSLYDLMLSIIDSPPAWLLSSNPSEISHIQTSAALFISVAQPFFFPKLSDQLQVIHRCMIDWSEAESNPTSPSNTQLHASLTSAIEKDIDLPSATQSHRSSFISAFPFSPQGAPAVSFDPFDASLTHCQLVLLAPSSPMEPRNASKLHLLRLLLSRFDCFFGARLLTDFLCTRLDDPTCRDSVAQLVKNLLTFVHYEVKERIRADRRVVDRSDELPDQVTRDELGRLFDVALSITERLQDHLLSHQAVVYQKQSEEEHARTQHQHEEQSEEDNESVDLDDEISITDNHPLTGSTPAASPLLQSRVAHAAFSRSHSLILTAPPPSLVAVDYFHYHASSLLQTVASLLNVAFEVTRLTSDDNAGGKSDGIFSLFSVLRRLTLPLIVVTSGFVSDTRPSLATQLLRSVSLFTEQITRVNRIAGKLLSQSGMHPEPHHRRFESQHPYRPFQNTAILLTLPEHGISMNQKPSKVRVKFDLDLCATASKYDYVQLFDVSMIPSFTRDRCIFASDSLQPLYDHAKPLSGRFFCRNFPRQELVFNSQHVVLYFHTGNSNRSYSPSPADWPLLLGFAVDVFCEYDVSHVHPPMSPDWISSLLHLSLNLSASLCAGLVRGMPVSESEQTAQAWTGSALLEGGVDRPESGVGVEQLTKRQVDIDFLNELSSLDGLTASLSSPSAATRLVAKLRTAGIDRSMVQRSIAQACQLATQQVFACLLKLTDHMDIAIECAASEARLDADVIKLWRRACEIKMDLRSQQDKTQDVSRLAEDIRSRCAFLLLVQSSSQQLQAMQDAKEATMPAKFTLDLIRKQSHMGVNIIGREASNSFPGTSSADVSDLPGYSRRTSRPSLEKRPSVWSKAKLIGSMMKSTVKTMKTLKSLLQIRTRAVDARAHNSDSLDAAANASLELIREKTSSSRLLMSLQTAMTEQRQRAEHRIVGLQAVRQMATKILALRSISASSHVNGLSHIRRLSLSGAGDAVDGGSLRERDEPLRLAEFFVSSISAAMRSNDSSFDRMRPRSTPILHQIDSAGLELKAFVFNEYFAFLSLFLDLYRDQQSTQGIPVTPGPLLDSLSWQCRLHLIHLCLCDFDKDDTDCRTVASTFFSKSHALLALHRIGAMSLVQQSQPLLTPMGKRDASVPWSVSFASWSMLRCMLYCATDALEPITGTNSHMSSYVDEDNANEIHSLITSQLIQQLRNNVNACQVYSNAEVDQLSSSRSSHSLSIVDSSVAYHLDHLVDLKEWIAGHQKSSARHSLSDHPSVAELQLNNCELLFAALRCVQSTLVSERLAASRDWIPLLVRLVTAPFTPSVHATSEQQRLPPDVIQRILAVRLLSYLLRGVHPSSPHFAQMEASVGQPILNSLFQLVCVSQQQRDRAPSEPPLFIVRLLATELVSLFRLLLASSKWITEISSLIESRIVILRNGQLQANTLSECLSALWLMGGGSPALGEAARVSFALQNEFFTGTIIRTIDMHGLEDGDPDSREPVFGVLVDEPDVTSDDDSTTQRTHRRLPSTALRSVYVFFASSLTPIDAVPVPLLSLPTITAHSIVESIVMCIRSFGGTDLKSPKARLAQLFEQMRPEPSSSPTPSPELPELNALSSFARASLHHSCLRALNVLLLRDDVAHLALELGVGPYLVPLACAPLAQPTTDSGAWDDTNVTLTELECRARAMSSLIEDRKHDTESDRQARLRVWSLSDATKQRESERKEAERRAEEEKRNSEDSKVPVLIINDFRHPAHPLIYHPRMPYMSGMAVCDQCGKRESGAVFHCAICKFDLCMTCIESTLASLRSAGSLNKGPLFPPHFMSSLHPHPLEYASSVYDSRFNCNDCGQDKSGAVYHCGPCQYDVCIACTVPVIQRELSRNCDTLMVNTENVEPRITRSATMGASTRLSSLGVDLTLLGFPKSRCESVSHLSESATSAVSRLLDELDATNPDLEAKFGLPTIAPLVSLGYWPITYKLPEGIEKIRAFMANFSESCSDFESGSGIGAGSEIDLIAQSGKVAVVDVGTDKEIHSTQMKQAAHRFTPSVNDIMYLPQTQISHAINHDPFAHRRESAPWRSVLIRHVVYHNDQAQLEHAAENNEHRLAVLYARRCLLSMLHLLKDQIRAEQPVVINVLSEGGRVSGHGHSASMSMTSSPFAHSRGMSPLSSPFASPRMTGRNAAAQSPSLRTLRQASPVGGMGSPLALPMSPMRSSPSRSKHQHSHSFSYSVGSHSLASIGPPGFLAPFVALLCSSPQQLTIPQQSSHLDVISGGGGQAGLRNLGDIVHTILMTEKQSLEAGTRSGFPMPHIGQREFARHAPIARHLLSDVCVRMLQLCRPDREINRNALINTVIYIFEAFMALEESRPAQPSKFRHKRLASIYGGDNAGDVHMTTKANLMLSLIFTAPVCILMMSCISEALSPPSSSSGSQMSAADQEYWAAMDRQRTVFARLFARVLAVKAKHMDESHAVQVLAPAFILNLQQHSTQSLSLPNSNIITSQQSWYRILLARLASLPLGVVTVTENEFMSGQRGTMNTWSMPYSFFCCALVDLSLVYDKFRKRLFNFAPNLNDRWKLFCEQQTALEEQDLRDASEFAERSRSPSGYRYSKKSPLIEPNDFGARARANTRASPQSSPRASPVLSPYVSTLLSGPATPVNRSALLSPIVASSTIHDENGNMSSIALTDMSASANDFALFGANSPMSFDSSQFPPISSILAEMTSGSSFEFSTNPITVSLRSHIEAQRINLTQNPIISPLNHPSSSVESYSRESDVLNESVESSSSDDSISTDVSTSSDVSTLPLTEIPEDEERRRSEVSSTDSDSGDEPSSPVHMTPEDRAKEVARKQRVRARESRNWFSNIAMLDATLTYLRSRAPPSKRDDRGSLIADSISFDIHEHDEIQLDEADEDVDLPVIDEQPNLRRTRSVEERAPLPIIGMTPESKKREIRDDSSINTTPQQVHHITVTSATPDRTRQLHVHETVDAITASTSSPTSSVRRALHFTTVNGWVSQADPVTPSEMLDLFFEPAQRDIFIVGDQKRYTALTDRVREEEAIVDQRAQAAVTDVEMALESPVNNDLHVTLHHDIPQLSTIEVEWTCPRCTLINSPTNTMCAACEQPTIVPPTTMSPTGDPDLCIYFELTVLNEGARGTIGIGLSTVGYPSQSMPGWEDGSYGWHGDDGCIFGGRGVRLEYGSRWQLGDTVGCGLWLRSREVFFTLNGEYQGVAFRDVPLIDYYGCVGMHSSMEAVSLNTGQFPFKFACLSSKFVYRPDVAWQLLNQNTSIEAKNTYVSYKTLAEEPELPINHLTSGVDGCIHIQTSSLLLHRGLASPVHSRSIGYAEFHVHGVNDSQSLALSVGLSTLDQPDSALHLGVDTHSYGLHTADGMVHSAEFPFALQPFCAPVPVKSGDVLGVGYDRAKREIFYTHNNQLLGVAFDQVFQSTLYAGCSLGLPGMHVDVNFGATAFVYEPMNVGCVLTNPLNMFGATLGNCHLNKACSRVTIEDGESLCVAHSTEVVIPKLPLQIELEQEAATHELVILPRSEWARIEGLFGTEEDEALVSLINRRCEKDESYVSSVHQVGLFSMTSEERVMYSCLSSINELDLQLRLSFLTKLNELLASIVHFTNLSRPARRSSLAKHFHDVHIRSIFFFQYKNELLRQACAATSFHPDTTQQRAPFLLKLDLFAASRLQRSRKRDVTGDKSLFGQAFNALYKHRHNEENKYGDHDTDPTRWFLPIDQGRPWKVQFIGLFADDYGGLFRDSLDRMCRELQSNTLNLFIPTPNAREQIGTNRHHFVPNPSAASPMELEMFTFVGQLMGMAIRTGELLFLDLPSIVWKPLVDEPITERDVMDIDRLSFTLVHEMKKLELSIADARSGLTPDLFTDYICSSFLVVGSDGVERELVPGGANIPVTWQNRLDFYQSLIAYRKQEFHRACTAIKSGLASVVPLATLSCFTWEQLRAAICGQPTLDIALLKQMTVYESCQADQPHIKAFWEVLSDRFSEAERASLLQFVNGSSRLPVKASEFERKFKIQAFYPSSGQPDDYLPVAHTCFFSLELPAYSSPEVLHQRLLYAITHCQAIDADSTDAARASGRMVGVVDSDDEDAQ